MGLVSRLGQFAGMLPSVWRASRSTDATADAMLWGDQLWSVPSTAGVEINQQTALSVTAVMAAVTMLTEDFSKLPASLYRHNDDLSRQVITDHPLAQLLEQPNEWQDWLEFAEMVQCGLVLRGNGYAVIMRDWRGRPVRLVPLNPDRVALWEAQSGELFYRVTPFGLHEMALLAELPFLIPFEDMLHIRGLSLNGLLGASRISVARDAIGLAIAQERASAQFLGSGARPSGVLTTDQKIDQDTADRLKARWKEMNSGLQNAGRTAIFEAGLKWTPLTLTAEDLEFISARQFQLQEIARLFRVPPHMIGELSRSTNNNITQQSQEYVNFTISGYTRRWKAKLRMMFGLIEAGIHVDFDLSELVRGDITARYNAYRIGIMSGFLKPNEARIDDGRDPDPKGNKLLSPTTMVEAGSQSTGTGAPGGGRPQDGTVPAASNPAPGGGRALQLGPEQIDAIARAVVQQLEHKRFNEDQPRDKDGQWTAGGSSVSVLTEHHDHDDGVMVLGVFDKHEDAAAAQAAKSEYNEREETGGRVDLHQVEVSGDHQGSVHVLLSADADGNVTVHGAYGAATDAKAGKDAILRDRWATEAPDLDYEDIWNDPKTEKVWDAEVSAWNATHPGQQIDPDRYTFGAQPEFEKQFSAKYLDGRKQPYPGAAKANEHFENDGTHMQLAKKKVRSFPNRFNEDQPRDDSGKWASGGGSGGDKPSAGIAGVKEKVAAAVSSAKEFVDGKSAGEVIAAVAASHKVQETAKEGLSLAIQGLINHVAGLDASTWTLNEDLVGHTVSHFSAIAQISKLQATGVIKAAVSGLISLRQAQIDRKRAEDDETDDVLQVLQVLHDALERHDPKDDANEAAAS
jgi:HK97 family phage portal protein